MANTKKRKRLKKGSKEAKEYMAKLRAARKVTVTSGTTNTTTTSTAKSETLEEIEKRLTKELQEGMLTKTEMKEAKIGAAGRHIKWVDKNVDKIAQWKFIRRELYPNGHYAANLENIRKE